MIHVTAIVDSTAKIGEGACIWNWSKVREGAVIGRGSSIGQSCYIDKNVVIGNNCRIQNHVDIYDGVKIGDDVFVGQGVKFMNCKHPRAWENSTTGGWKLEKTFVKDKVSIGAGALILPGIVLKERCVIGAGAVVTKSTKRGRTYVGNPARELIKAPSLSSLVCSACSSGKG